MIPKVIKERVYMKGGALRFIPTSNRLRTATDVRWCVVKPSDVKDVKFVYERGATVAGLVSKHKAHMGSNFPYFYNGVMLGDSEDQDVVISSAYGKMLVWHEFAFVNGKFSIGQLNKRDEQDLLIQSAPLLVNNGKECWDWYSDKEQVQDDVRYSSAQRTFFGLNKNGHLIMAWADGRRLDDKGLTLQEMAKFMLNKGAVIALNGDGGGSTTCATRDTNGKVSILNANRSNPRVVHHALLFWFT